MITYQLITSGFEVAKLRRAAGMTQLDLCRLLGISRNKLSKLENTDDLSHYRLEFIQTLTDLLKENTHGL